MLNTQEMLGYLLTNPKSFSKAKEKINKIYNNAIYNNKERYQRVLEIAKVMESINVERIPISLEKLCQLSDHTINAVTNAVRELYFRSLKGNALINHHSNGSGGKYGRGSFIPHTIPTGCNRVSNMRLSGSKYLGK